MFFKIYKYHCLKSTLGQVFNDIINFPNGICIIQFFFPNNNLREVCNSPDCKVHQWNCKQLLFDWAWNMASLIHLGRENVALVSWFGTNNFVGQPKVSLKYVTSASPLFFIKLKRIIPISPSYISLIKYNSNTCCLKKKKRRYSQVNQKAFYKSIQYSCSQFFKLRQSKLKYFGTKEKMCLNNFIINGTSRPVLHSSTYVS